MRSFVVRSVVAGAALLALAAPAAGATGSPAEVVVDSGAIRGGQDGGALAWKGIPYAAAPLGANRWRAPQPAPAWKGVRETTAFGHDCMQTVSANDPTPLTTTPSEDCLYLNVWRPARVAARKKLPVLVWIYGGGFMWGGSSIAVTDGARLAEQGVVVVSFNYRLGRLGFFAHPALTAANEGPSGDFGYMDILSALGWIRRNIGQFGGDPRQVTVFGESAGGAAVQMLLTSPAARGLVDRVAVMSGGGVSPTGLGMRSLHEDRPGLPSAEKVGVNFARSVGVEGEGADALEKLRALPAERVVRGVSMRDLMGADPAATYTGGPVLDGSIARDVPLTVLARGEQDRIPVLIGSTGADISVPGPRSLEEVFATFGARAQAARQAYDPQGTGDLRTLAQAVSMDHMMTAPARFVASAVSKGGASAWYYRFSYVAEAQAATQRASATHGSDIPYAFDTVGVRYGAATTARDKAVAKAFSGYLVNFAKTGDPNGHGLPRWRPFAAAPAAVLNFAADGQVGQAPDPWKARLDVTAATTKAH